jgi:hypothetical protein
MALSPTLETSSPSWDDRPRRELEIEPRSASDHIEQNVGR